MVKHIVMWNFKEDVPEGEKKAIKEKAKKELEALVGVVPGLSAAFVITEQLLPAVMISVLLQNWRHRKHWLLMQ